MGLEMELRSFLAGIFFLLGVEMLMPFAGVKVAIVLPYAPGSTIVGGVLALVLAYYLFRGN